VRFVAALVAALALAAGCSGERPPAPPVTTPAAPSVTTPAAPSVTTPAAPSVTTPAAPTPPVPSLTRPPVAFDAPAAAHTVDVLAEQIGPREATTEAYRRAAAFVSSRFESYGYTVTRQGLTVPAGVSWGEPVPAGRTYNVIATPAGFAPTRRHVLVGAHLDTVPQAPGAEDNASGIAVLLELTRMAATAPPLVPLVFVAFAAEEPRGSGDDRHHYGSRAYVAGLRAAERRAVTGMLSLDRVGVGDRVRVCTGGRGTRAVARELLAVAGRLRVPAVSCENRASDHWSFEKAGLAAARIGATPYAEYHSPRDRAHVVDRAQLARNGRVAWGWLSSLR